MSFGLGNRSLHNHNYKLSLFSQYSCRQYRRFPFSRAALCSSAKISLPLLPHEETKRDSSMKLWLFFPHKLPFYPYFLHSLISTLTFMRSDRLCADVRMESPQKHCIFLWMLFFTTSVAHNHQRSLSFTPHPLYPASGNSQVDAANWTR